ncbi:2-amino-4-hydroxy-6-hydroxymethyldihydropteridine diphosphokinase [Roseibacterium beibuensis]|nr:2-amino-4-hydroxy-6-hydroxymethyldihydropteridine diphosphokinase [Roseibacterium beibuensis]MCS6626686.1 2-amino-4-hydroxy-6-hydroxymethyldihydropteridine diphosphokinase [Roseibacterium beibuensis]
MPLPVDAAPLSAEISNADTTVFVALGANLPGPFGGPAESLRHAMERLREMPDGVLHGGTLYSTPAYPAGNGPDYVNAVLAVRASDTVRFVANAFGIESEFNRDKDRAAGRWAPRAIDIDIVAIGGQILPDPARHAALRAKAPIDRVLTDEGLVVPHPAMQERAFVLKPMAFFAPSWRHPALDRTALELAEALPAEELDAVRAIT